MFNLIYEDFLKQLKVFFNITIILLFFYPKFICNDDLIILHLVGRFVYFCPFASNPHTYAYKLIRIDLGMDNIISALDATGSAGIIQIVDVLDLTQKSSELAGFSGIFTG